MGQRSEGKKIAIQSHLPEWGAFPRGENNIRTEQKEGKETFFSHPLGV